MGKLNLVAKPTPVSSGVLKHAEEYQEIVDAWDALAVGTCIEIMKEQLPVSTVEVKARKLIKPKEGEYLRISRIIDKQTKNVTGVRLSKVAERPKQRKQKAASQEPSTES